MIDYNLPLICENPRCREGVIILDPTEMHVLKMHTLRCPDCKGQWKLPELQIEESRHD